MKMEDVQCCFRRILPNPCAGCTGACSEQRSRQGRGSGVLAADSAFTVSVAAAAGTCTMMAAKQCRRSLSAERGEGFGLDFAITL